MPLTHDQCMTKIANEIWFDNRCTLFGLDNPFGFVNALASAQFTFRDALEQIQERNLRSRLACRERIRREQPGITLLPFLVEIYDNLLVDADAPRYLLVGE